MGDSAEEMLNVTMKRIDAIMENFTAQEALAAETHNLIEAAIAILVETEDISGEKAVESWGKLQEAAKSLYIESMIIRGNGLAPQQFHLSGELMQTIMYCKERKKYMETL